MNLINPMLGKANNYQNVNVKQQPIVLKSYTDNQPPSIKEDCIHITVSGDKQAGYSFIFDDKHCFDEERMYTFKPDGSATILSFAWGTKQEFPKGTFSELYSSFPEKAEDIDFETAKKALDMNREKAIKYTDAKQILNILHA